MNKNFLRGIGSNTGIGNNTGIGSNTRIGNNTGIGKLDFSFKKVRGRREFFDLIKNYIKKNQNISEIKLKGFFQYTTGASQNSINQALAVLESINLIECIENPNPPFERSYK